MTITTVAGAIAGTQPPIFFMKSALATGTTGKPASFWGGGGFPSGGAFDNTLNGVTLSSSSVIPAGALPHYDPGSGSAYLSRLEACSNTSGLLMLCDRLWHNGNINASSTLVQSITFPGGGLPARDADGAISGKSVWLGLEVESIMGAGTPTIDVIYTNSAGTASRHGSFMDATITTAPASAFYRISAAAGDVGVQSVQSLQFTGPWASGTCHLVAYRILGAIELIGNGVPNAFDALIGGLPVIYNGTVPFFIFLEGAGAAAVLNGIYVETWG